MADPERDESMDFVTSRSPGPYLFESQMAMVGRMGRGWTPRRRFFARVVALLALLPFLVTFGAAIGGLLVG